MHAKLHVHQKITVGANVHRLIYSVLIDIISLHVVASVKAMAS